MTHLSTRHSLIWIDSEPLLNEERSRCLRLRHKIDRSRAQLEQFQRETLPAFEQWIATTFGAELTRLRETMTRYSELRELLEDVQEEFRSSGCSERTAYRRVMQRRESGEPILERESPDEEAASDHSSEEHSQESFEGFFEGERSSGKRQQQDSEDEPPTRSRESQSGRIKELYRALARKLHPDMQAGLTSAHRDLWHQVQEAYEAQDLDRLEALAAYGELLSDQLDSVGQIGTLRRMFEELDAQRRALERELRQARKERAWGFEKARRNDSRLRRLAREVASEMEEERAVLSWRVERMEALVEKWSKPAKRQTTRRQKRPAR